MLGQRCRCADNRAAKMVPSRSLAARNVRQVIREAIFDVRAPEPRCSFFVDRACRSHSLQNGAAPFGDVHEASRFVSHAQPSVNGQRFAQHADNFPQYEYENHAAISSCREESEARSSVPATFPLKLRSALYNSNMSSHQHVL